MDNLRGEHGELKRVGNDCPVSPDSFCQLIDVSVSALVQPPLPHNAIGYGVNCKKNFVVRRSAGADPVIVYTAKDQVVFNFWGTLH